MKVYYNENDPYAAQWLRNLIAAGHIAAGDVDDRSIVDVAPDDVRGYDQAHFFAGIGLWSLALRLAGADDLRCWTGSCPCQPFSSAGKQKGAKDERHLWPELRRLVAECHLEQVFGEQVASRLGREWLAGVRTDLEALGYAVGAADLCAASVGAPHIRQRLFWLADARCAGDERGRRSAAAYGATGSAQGEAQQRQRRGADAGDCGATMGPLERQAVVGGSDAYWSDCVLIPCSDGKTRRAQSSIQPLAHNGEWGTGSRVGILRGAGNAIVAPLAAEFIRACLSSVNQERTSTRTSTTKASINGK